MASRLLSVTSHLARSMSSSSSSTQAGAGTALRFAQFDVSKQAFLRRPSVAAIVNLKPIVPGHVLVIPTQPCARLADLPQSQRGDFWQAVHEVSDVVKQRYGGTSLTVSVQDGPEAGQSVPHLHVHVLPRRAGDFTPNDEIYEHLERFGLGLFAAQSNAATASEDTSNDGSAERRPLQVDADEARKPRSAEEMAREAAWLAQAFA